MCSTFWHIDASNQDDKVVFMIESSDFIPSIIHSMSPISIAKMGPNVLIVPDNARVQVHVPLEALVSSRLALDSTTSSPSTGLPNDRAARSDEPLRRPRRRRRVSKIEKAHRRSSLPYDLEHGSHDDDGTNNDGYDCLSGGDQRVARRRKSVAADGDFSSDDEETDLVPELPENTSLMRHLGNLLQTQDAVLQIVADNPRMHSDSKTKTKLETRLRPSVSAPILDQRFQSGSKWNRNRDKIPSKGESRWDASSSEGAASNGNTNGHNARWESTARTKPSLSADSKDFLIGAIGNSKDMTTGRNESAKARLLNMGFSSRTGTESIACNAEADTTQRNATWGQPTQLSTPASVAEGANMSLGNDNERQACRWSIPSRKSDSNLIYPKRQTSQGLKS